MQGLVVVGLIFEEIPNINIKCVKVTGVHNIAGLLVAHFENIGFHIGSSYSKYRLFTGFSIKNIG